MSTRLAIATLEAIDARIAAATKKILNGDFDSYAAARGLVEHRKGLVMAREIVVQQAGKDGEED